jgi:hypothetical protein
MTQTTPTPVEESAPNPPARNPAVLRCCAARDRSIQESRAKHRDKYDTDELAGAAYLHAMPDLSGYENIRDFIACVAHGLIVGVVDPIEAPKFFYAAQVAIGALRHEPKAHKAA